MTASLAVVLGRPPGPSSVLRDVAPMLVSAGVDVHVVVASGGVLPDVVRSSGLRLLKDLDEPTLAALAAQGLDCCNGAAATAAALDKRWVMDRLRAAGVPVPTGMLLPDWAQVQAAAQDGPVVVKPLVGCQGKGVLLLRGPAPASPPVPGPWLVQERLEGDGRDRKLYVVGDAVDAVTRSWPAPTDRSGDPSRVTAELAALARAAAWALGLEVCGVDVLVTTAGPFVVDVNALPGFKGVPGAAERLSRHLLARLGVQDVVSACV